MSSPLYQLLGGNQQNNMLGQFQKFMNDMRGKDPNAEINRLLQSGQISQEQLNQAQQMAHQMMGMFGRR